MTEAEPQPRPVRGLVTGWLRDFAVAAVFLTRLPFRVRGGIEAHDLACSVRAFPLVGLLVGGIAGAGLMAGAELGFFPLSYAFLGVAFGVLVTGGLHEDGLADVADGFGAGRTADDRIRIMRDSHIGAFGVLALILAIGFKVAFLSGLPGPGTAAVAVTLAAVLSRAMMAAVMYLGRPARADGLAAGAGRPGPLGALTAFLLAALIAVMVFGVVLGLGILVAAAAAAALMGLLAWRRIGGYTGDVLGAVQQLSEIAVLAVLGTNM